MPELEGSVLGELARWDPGEVPVSSLYLNVDGRRYPREEDVRQRARKSLHRLREQAVWLSKSHGKSVGCDAGRMMEFIEDEFERGSTRGLALFACHEHRLWQEVRTARPLPDRATVGRQPYLLPLEAMLETQRSLCAAIVDKEKARIFLSSRDVIEERTEIVDDVPGHHEQGGRAQARFQRHVDDHVGRHLRRVADVLLDMLRRGDFDHLIVAGPEEALAELERLLHDWVGKRIVGRTSLPITAAPAQVLERMLEIEQQMESEKESRMLERLRAGAATGRGAVLGVPATLRALNDARVDTLVVPFDSGAPGVRCPECGMLDAERKRCPRCGIPTAPVIDLFDAAVAAALRQRATVETVSHALTEDDGAIGALLRF
ncbi:MAG TPA: Vms1/Ankzf1 family peptidyl-tRNA hydrolase [Actinomycetota bacterium]|nr:Vms1/Ankzf1 family peptidyl-tRNA hydrolase [Actinomycetota bacterium]